MKKNMIKCLLIVLNPVSPVFTLIVGWMLTILVTEPNEKFPSVVNYMILNPLVIMIFIILWFVFTIVFTIMKNRMEELREELERKEVTIREKNSQLEQTSGIVLNRSGDFAEFNRQLRFNEVLKSFVENNMLIESAQIYTYSIKRIGEKVQIKVKYNTGYVYENVDINNLAQTYYEIDYKDYNRIKDLICVWKEVIRKEIGSKRKEDQLIDYLIDEIKELLTKYYNDLSMIDDVSKIEAKHFTEYRIMTLLMRLARRYTTTTFDKKNILGEDKVEIERFLLNGKRTGILNSILLEDTFMFKYTRNSHKKDGRAYVSFHANISNQNYVVIFSLQTNDLDKYTDLEQDITLLKQDFISRIKKK